MKMQKEIMLKIYLKHKRRPFKVIIDNMNQIGSLEEMIETRKVVRFGLIMFDANEFKYMVVI